MMRRMMLALFFVLLVVTSAWPKFKEDEQQYLNDQFKAIQDQVRRSPLSCRLSTRNFRSCGRTRRNFKRSSSASSDHLRSWIRW